MRSPVPPEGIVRDTNSGRALALSALLNALRGGVFSIFHSPEFCTVAAETTPLETGYTPCTRFADVFPGTSSKCAGTTPRGPLFKCTQVTVAGRQVVYPPWPKFPGSQTQPIPGSKAHPPK